MNLNLLALYFSLLTVGFFSTGESYMENSLPGCVEARAPKETDTVPVHIVCPAPKRDEDDACKMQDTWVVLVVNPTLNDKVARRLDIVWHVPEVLVGDIIRVYKNDKTPNTNPVYEVVPYAHFGVSETGLIDKLIEMELKFKPICMGYYVAYWREKTVIASSCLQTNPTWMKDYNFGNMRLWDMFIPGTHDSSAYHTSYHPESINKLDNYVFTQEDNILEQLLHGARALDLRVGKDEGQYFAHHGVAKLYPFQEVADHINSFLQGTEEILILDFHDFPIGINQDSEHLEFVNYIVSEFGDHMADPGLGWYATLDDIWRTGRRLIVSYNHNNTYEARKDILWPPITQMWGNVQKVDDLYDYLIKTFESPPKGMWSAQSELTAKGYNIATNDLGGLRKMANDANTMVSRWYRGRWGRECHIVAMDYIRASSIVDIAIEWNLRKTLPNPCPVDAKEEEERLKREERLRMVQGLAAGQRYAEEDTADDDY